MTLVLPVAGLSSRFPNMKPKYLLTHPNGNLMIIEAIRGLNLKDFKEILVICLKKHYDEFELERVLGEQFGELNLRNRLKIVALKEQTDSQPETVYQGLKIAGIKGPIFIKDSDNFFAAKITPGNLSVICDLNDLDKIKANNKSYVSLNEQGIITNIVEKKIISAFFNAGGYGFASAAAFCEHFESLKNEPNLYISHIIYKMLLGGEIFTAIKTESVEDWGTLREWNAYKKQFATIFIDIDGTILESSGPFFRPLWGETGAIAKNAAILRQLYKSGKVHIVLTTSRKRAAKKLTIEQLKRENIPYHDIIFDLPHAKRILVNDYERSNPYKSAESVNLRRNSDELEEMLKDILNIES